MSKDDRRFLRVMVVLGLIYTGILVWPWIFQPNVFLPPKQSYWLDAAEVTAHSISLFYLFRLIRANRRGDNHQKSKFQDFCMCYAIAGVALRVVSVLSGLQW